MRSISIVRSLYFRIFSTSFLITFLSPEIATAINMHVLFPLPRIIMSGLLLLLLWNWNFNSYNFANLCNLARRKCKNNSLMMTYRCRNM
jgi:hypothetical protein